MMFSVCFSRSLLLLFAGLVLSGCLPSAQSQLDEEKEPHFLAGKGRVSTMDYKGAVESFEKALEVNPQSASAHFELGCLFDQKESDPAAAIYHYEHYLKLRSNAENTDVVKGRIMACKQALAQTVSLGPVTEKVQREFEHLTEENKRLAEENKRLREDMEKWTAYATRLQSLTNQSGALPPANRLAPSTGSGQAAQAGSTALNAGSVTRGPSIPTAGARTHTVKPGETLAMVARRYGIRLETLMAANPRLDPRRLKVGQTLSVPAP